MAVDCPDNRSFQRQCSEVDAAPDGGSIVRRSRKGSGESTTRLDADRPVRAFWPFGRVVVGSLFEEVGGQSGASCSSGGVARDRRWHRSGVVELGSTWFLFAGHSVRNVVSGKKRHPQGIGRFGETRHGCRLDGNAHDGGNPRRYLRRSFETFGSLSEEGTPWDAGQLVVFAVAGLAFFSWLIFKPTPRTEPKSAKPFEIPILWSHFGALRELRSSRPLFLAALGDAWFWAFGGFFFFVLVKWAAIVGDPERFGFWFGLLGVGIMLGSMISAYVGRGRVELGIVPLGALGIPVALICLTLSDPMSTSFNVCCVLLGVGGAFFFVPLNAFLQDRAGEERRGRVVAASNLLTNLLSVAFIGIHAFLSNYLNLNPIEELWVMTVPAVLIAGFVWYLLPEEIFRIATRALTRIFYRLSVKGVENLPKKGGALILCNHVSYADPVMIGVSLPRYLQFIAFSGLAESWLVRFVFRLTSAIPVSPSRAKEAIVKSSEKLRSGDAICIFPEGGISRVGPLLGFKKGFELIARKGQAPVVPAYLDGVWGSIFSFSDGKFLRKWPRRIPYPVRFHVGEPIPAKEATVDRVRRSMFRLAREAFSERKDLERPLSLAIKASLLRDRSAPFLVEVGGKIWTREEFYAKSQESDRFRSEGRRSGRSRFYFRYLPPLGWLLSP